MKPRTILQKEVAELSHHLPEITAAQKEWAKEPILRDCLYR
ncbi:hypothetical protein PORUE0001_0213 [Porphyromonas uenonis 60-3]|uniref:Uncharacterized protein n=1 Tax=Porphyromonas uenonis 60-3 TaxID=596327 RepID=C2ME57_9PORP|nr:hypothetical protein [Porphyromonas uenonis]EEK15977.1 hypothetical protein PORUE0001_0213 [Porphyromonas uenonis 60-3]